MKHIKKVEVPTYKEWKNCYMILTPDLDNDLDLDYPRGMVIGVVKDKHEARETADSSGWGEDRIWTERIKTKKDYERALYSSFNSDEIENGVVEGLRTNET